MRMLFWRKSGWVFFDLAWVTSLWIYMGIYKTYLWFQIWYVYETAEEDGVSCRTDTGPLWIMLRWQDKEKITTRWPTVSCTRTAIPAPALLDEGDRVLSFPSLWRTWLLPLGLLHLKLQTSHCTRREHMTSSEKTCEALQTSISQQLQWRNETDSWCVFHCPSSRRLSVVSHSKLPNPSHAYSKLQTDTVWFNSRSKITKMSCTLVCGSFDWLLFTEGVCPTGWCQIRELHKTSASTQSSSLQWLTPTRPSTAASHYPAWRHLKELRFNKNWPENVKREKGCWKAKAPLKKRNVIPCFWF